MVTKNKDPDPGLIFSGWLFSLKFLNSKPIIHDYNFCKKKLNFYRVRIAHY